MNRSSVFSLMNFYSCAPFRNHHWWKYRIISGTSQQAPMDSTSVDTLSIGITILTFTATDEFCMF